MEIFWVEQTTADFPSESDWLCPAERARLAALLIPKRRAEWCLGRWTAKAAAVSYLGLCPTLQQLAAIEIRASKSGAPEVFCDDQPAPVAISLTHRYGAAACTIAARGARFGCDLELVEPRDRIFVSDYFSQEEQQIVSLTSIQQRAQVVTLIWSAKESALKALRTGLRLPTRCVVVRVGDGDEYVSDLTPALSLASWAGVWSPLTVHYLEGEVFHGWWRFDGKFVRTLVSTTSVPRPLSLRVDRCNQLPGPQCMQESWRDRQHVQAEGALP